MGKCLLRVYAVFHCNAPVINQRTLLSDNVRQVECWFSHRSGLFLPQPICPRRSADACEGATLSTHVLSRGFSLCLIPSAVVPTDRTLTEARARSSRL